MTIFYIIMNKSIKKLICVSLFSMCAVSLKAQNLPELYSIGVGGGLSASAAKTNASYSFFEKNGNRLGYNLNMDSRFYFCEWFALGLQYDYNNIQKGKDKAHVHFIRPALTLRYVMNRDALFFNLGVGLFNYQDRVYNINSRYNYYSNNISKNYCGISFTLGYEFPITGNLSGSVRADIQTANWFVNDDFRLFNPDKIGCDDEYEYCDKYDDGINHNLFKNDLTFCNFTFSLVFGK